jgi:hypothetical protein
LPKSWSFFYPPLLADQSPTGRKKLYEGGVSSLGVASACNGNASWCWRLRRLLTFPAAHRIRLFAYQLITFSLQSTWKTASSKDTWLHGGDMRICMKVMFRSWDYI